VMLSQLLSEIDTLNGNKPTFLAPYPCTFPSGIPHAQNKQLSRPSRLTAPDLPASV
jgi:hypothetical protein